MAASGKSDAGAGDSRLHGSRLHGRLQPFAAPILLAGLVMHVWGMYDKHRLETRAGAVRVWWAELLYLCCWASLAVLLVYMVAAP